MVDQLIQRTSALLLAAILGTAAGPALAAQPVHIGMSAEFGHLTSTSDDSIRAGIRIAIAEINARGGVLGGRPLELIERDDRSVPARAVANYEELAGIPDMVAVFCGKFSPTALAALPALHRDQLILLDPWAAADGIIDNGYEPSYAFRLSLRDSWAIDTLMERALSRGLHRIGVMLPNTAWGRSSLQAVEKFLARGSRARLAGTVWYNWGDASLAEQFAELRQAGAEAILLVANEREGAILVREMAARPPADRLPILSHWGVTGGDLFGLAEGRLAEVDFEVVQSFSFVGREGETPARIAALAQDAFGVNRPGLIPSPAGLAHAYDLTQLLARAIDVAGTTSRPAVRDALERLPAYDGLVRRYDRPFMPRRHEALQPEQLFIADYAPDGALVPVQPQGR